ncbi:rrna-processing utp23-like protein, partial [Nannochloropsis gaditana CCMP526]
ILVDGNFIHMALKVKIDIRDRLKKMLLVENLACYAPQAVLDELAAMGPDFRAAHEWVQSCCDLVPNPTIKTNHDDSGKNYVSAGAAICTMVGEKNIDKYMVATQDQELKARLRHVPSVALLFVSRAVFLMEAPSISSRLFSAKQEGEKFRLLTEEERCLLASLRHKEKPVLSQGSSQASEQQQKALTKSRVRLKKRAKGPNPLSVKKSDKAKVQKERRVPQDKPGSKKYTGGQKGNEVGGGHVSCAKKRTRQRRKGKPVLEKE